MVALIIVTAGDCRGGETEDLVLRMLSKSGRTTDLSVINEHNREAVLSLLRKIATQEVMFIGTAAPDDLGAELVLLRLNDQPTVDRLMELYKGDYGSRNSFWVAEHFEMSGQAALIPKLGDDFFLEDGEKGRFERSGQGTLLVMPRSAFSGITTCESSSEASNSRPRPAAGATSGSPKGVHAHSGFPQHDARVVEAERRRLCEAGLRRRAAPASEHRRRHAKSPARDASSRRDAGTARNRSTTSA